MNCISVFLSILISTSDHSNYSRVSFVALNIAQICPDEFKTSVKSFDPCDRKEIAELLIASSNNYIDNEIDCED